MKKSDEIRRQIATLVDHCDGMINRAEADGRDMTADEQKEFNAKMAKCKVLEDDFAAASKIESNTRALRATQTAINTAAPVYNPDGTQAAGGYADQNWRFDGNGPGINVAVRDPKLSAFKGPNAARDAYDSALAIKAVLFKDSTAQQKLISRKGEAFVASLNENNPVDGGYAVAPEFGRAVFTAWEQTGAIQQLAKRIPMKSDSMTLLKQTAGTTVYYPGEEGEITPSDLDLGRVSLIPKKRAILAYMSNELNDDAVVPVMDMLATDMGHQFALKQDNEGVLGDATSTYGGVSGIKQKLTAATASISTCATGHDTWPEIDLSDLAACMSLVPDKFRVQGELAWFCSAAFKWQVFDRLALGTGGALAMQMVDGIPQLYFNGIPIVLSDRCQTTTAAATISAYFGNWSQALMLGERTQIRIATSEHVAFTSDRLAIRGTTRYDINVHEPGNTSTAGAIVALKTAA